MPLFFIKETPVAGKVVKITGEDAHHISKVLRYKKGDIIEVSNGISYSGEGIIEEIDNKNNIIKVKIIKEEKDESGFTEITLFQAIPKGQKFDLIVQKNVEIGVKRIVPVFTKRIIPRYEEVKISDKIERWNKIAMEAAKQCKRKDIPLVEKPLNFQQLQEKIKNFDFFLVPWENEKSLTLKQVMNNIKKGEAQKIAIFIGPEGGFDEEEIKNCVEKGAIPLTLGKRILRTETAGFVVSTIMMYELADLGG
ncbi:Ribosomal RNA small subunit methyltransferase E [Thermovenabulum gondwanense]|uniref:Ribosomal RNA small subunit methyltransferase E n=2 Tax=Thermovenabulum gondwanense TaxID=520767 RepID=A0A162MBJ3_9FIRM|nr:Ribosomal RNA small subunit methyltransferase E [Thermovenabulum gondwanense]